MTTMLRFDAIQTFKAMVSGYLLNVSNTINPRMKSVITAPPAYRLVYSQGEPWVICIRFPAECMNRTPAANNNRIIPSRIPMTGCKRPAFHFWVAAAVIRMIRIEIASDPPQVPAARRKNLSQGFT